MRYHNAAMYISLEKALKQCREMEAQFRKEHAVLCSVPEKKTELHVNTAATTEWWLPP